MSDYPLLSKISLPEDLRELKIDQLPELCNEVREYLVDTLSDVGGHFSSNLGVVELTVAIHYVYNTPQDKLIWDVGHQIYPHKILTGRREHLKSVRKLGGLSGFPKKEESIYDLYNTGHAGTSISQCLGEAVARDKKGLDYKCLAVIGDASAASGMAFEALNHGGHLQTDCTVILNDNDMSISHNVGALNLYLNRLITSPIYNKWRKFGFSVLMWIPFLGPVMQLFIRKLEKSFKDFLTPGSLFQDFGFRYIGPVDGHDVKELVRVLTKTTKLKGPMVIHVYTQKGKGYKPAEQNPIQYHHVNTFNKLDGSPRNLVFSDNEISFSDIVGETLIEIIERNDDVVAITPAMIEGSGLRKLYNKYPEKVYDVGIAEQHSVAFAGGLVAGGLKPYLCIYSTFLSRGFDQLIQDVALMNLPVRILVDRAGCVGPDGETHQGLFDLGLLLCLPNMQIYAPSSGAELKAILNFMETDIDFPIAVRFPKESCAKNELSLHESIDILDYRPKVFGSGTDIAIVCIGTMLETGLKVEKILRLQNGIESSVIGINWIRPLDFEYLEKSISKCKKFILIEDSYENSSASNYIKNNLSPELLSKYIKTFSFPNEPILHGTRKEIFHKYGMSASKISDYLSEILEFSEKSNAVFIKPVGIN